MTTIWQLCEDATNVLRDQASLVETKPPLVMCGDIHGQFVDLKRIFNKMGYPPFTKYMFLGDIVDRGTQSVETIVLLLLYKVGGNVVPCRGRENLIILQGQFTSPPPQF